MVEQMNRNENSVDVLRYNRLDQKTVFYLMKLNVKRWVFFLLILSIMAT